MGKSEQPKVRHRMGRPYVVFRELQVVKALGIHCQGPGCQETGGGQRGKRGLEDAPKEVGGDHFPADSSSELCFGHMPLEAVWR